MKKLAIAAFMLVTFAGASFAQTTPKKTTKAADKVEKKATPSASSDTTGHKHMHKGTKHKA